MGGMGAKDSLSAIVGELLQVMGKLKLAWRAGACRQRGDVFSYLGACFVCCLAGCRTDGRGWRASWSSGGCLSMEVVHEGTLQLEPAWGEGHADLARRWGHARGKEDWPACKDARHGLLRWGAVGIVVAVCWETWSQGMASRKKKHVCLALGRREEKARRLGWLATGLKLEHCSRDI